VRLLTEKLPPAPARIADLGCGTGTLTVLLADAGHRVDGLDFSPAMLAKARVKTAGHSRVRLVEGDASDPPLPPATYDVVLSRHVLWAMPDPAEALRRWVALLRPEGVLVLIEGRWSNGFGLTPDQTLALVEDAGRRGRLTPLDDPVYWGRAIDDERYLVVSPPPPA
jgi:ubiquinone/menaquinone biosynthesis C-methylase UbiE